MGLRKAFKIQKSPKISKMTSCYNHLSLSGVGLRLPLRSSGISILVVSRPANSRNLPPRTDFHGRAAATVLANFQVSQVYTVHKDSLPPTL
jgi:hypothetical protein